MTMTDNINDMNETPMGPKDEPVGTGLEIAVIGMAGRFPGAGSIERFWENLKNGVESILFFSVRELEEAGVSPQLLANPLYIKAKGYLDGAEYFDPAFFNYTPVEAAIMDPQLRIYHECAWATLEDAGYNPDIYPDLIGVYSAASPNIAWLADVFNRGSSLSQQFDVFNLNSSSAFSTRISYHLNLKGPGLTVQTACSSSLVAIHLACQGLLNAECDMALAGSVSLDGGGKAGYLYQDGMIHSPDGHCRTFDARAAGTVVGEGTAAVLLKRLEDALHDGDHIYAVVKGTAINNDARRKIGYTAPSVEGQAEVIRTALAAAEVEPESISFIEAHGTGTALGDPIEIEALKLAFGAAKKHFCALGSVKSNLGHLGNAAGITGFIKVVLALEHRLIPPSLYFETPNPKIDFENSPFYVNTRLKEWKRGDSPRRAGVSSFGIGGTNAHAILEESPTTMQGCKESPGEQRNNRLFLLSARTQGALGRMRENLAHYLETNPGIDPADAAYTLQVGRKTLKYRGFTVGETLMDVVSDLKDGSLSKFQVLSSMEEGLPVIFMFSGQGSQYTHMGIDLYKTESLFRETFDRCFDILKTISPHPLAKILWPSLDHSAVDSFADSSATGEVDERIDYTEIAQPLLFIFEYSLARLLQTWGVEPAAMIGHSIGEYTAACLSGVFTPEEALKLVTLRGSLMRQLPTGAMLSVNIAEKDILPYLTDQVCLAAVNGHTNCVISGPHQAVAAFAEQMKRKGYETRPLHTSHAFHSHMMEAILEPFTREAAKIKAKKPRLPYISNVTGQWIREVETSEPTYWARHLRDTVRFYDGITEILKKEPRAIFIEVGPGRVLSTLVRQYGHPRKKSTQPVLNLTRHPNEQVADDRFLAAKLAQMWQYGVSIDWAGYNRGEKRRRISLPTYPFERQSFAPRSFGGNELGSLSGHENRDSEAPALQEIFAGHFQPRPELSAPYAAATDKTQETLVSIWKQFFGIDGIGIRDDFFELGGDSLKGLTMIAEIRKAFNAELTLTHLFTTPTIQGLAETVKNAGEANYYAIESVEEREYYPLSSAQERLYFLQQLRPESVFYNIAVVMEIEGKLDLNQVQIFEHAFETLIGRHESLRTAFCLVDGKPVQVVRRPGDVDFRIQYRELLDSDPGIVIDGFIQPFDLTRAPLMRLEIVKSGADKYLWLFDIHHIICDATAYAILLKELIGLYNCEELPPLRIQYRDFSQWQNQLSRSGRIAGQSGYWLKTFSDGVPALNFPTDYPRPKSLEFKGSFLEFHLPEEEALRFLEINGSEGVTLFMSLLTVLNILLSRYTGKSDIVIGSTAAGRPHPDLREMIGMFVNMLPMRNFPRPHMTYRELLQEVKTSTLQVFENQDVQFEMLVKLLNLEIASSRNPLFDICINVENYEHPALEAPGLLFKFYQHRYRNAKFDMLLWANRLENGIQFMLEYSTELFKFSTAEAFLNHFIEIIRQVIENKDTRLSDIHISQRLLIPESHVPEIDFEL